MSIIDVYMLTFRFVCDLQFEGRLPCACSFLKQLLASFVVYSAARKFVYRVVRALVYRVAGLWLTKGMGLGINHHLSRSLSAMNG